MEEEPQSFFSVRYSFAFRSWKDAIPSMTYGATSSIDCAVTSINGYTINFDYNKDFTNVIVFIIRKIDRLHSTINNLMVARSIDAIDWCDRLMRSIDAIDWCDRLMRSIDAIDAIDWCDRLMRSIDAIDWCDRLMRSIDAIDWCDRLMRSIDAIDWCDRYLWKQ